MTQTTNLKLNVFADSDPVLVANLNANAQKLDALPQIVTGTHTGNNTKGSANAVTIAFDRKPLLFLIGGNDYIMIGIRGLNSMLTRVCMSGVSTGNEDVSITWGNKSVTFYSERNASAMCNDGATYTYAAILGET